MRSLRRTETDPIQVNSAIRQLQTRAFPSWQTIIKPANETAVNNTYQDDDSLTFPVEASTTYRFRFVCMYDTPTAADLKIQLTGPASPTLIQALVVTNAPAAVALVTVMWTAFSTSQSITSASTTAGAFTIDGVLQNGTTAGNVTLQWAQVTSSGTSTMYAGSYVEFSTFS